MFKNFIFHFVFLAVLLFSKFLFAADSVTGFWKIIDDETGKARSIVALYTYQEKLFGRIIVTFDEAEKVKNTIYKPDMTADARAEKLPGKPFFAGLDMIWNLQKDKSKTKWVKGRILDPKKARVYSSEISFDEKNQRLVVRGKIGPIGRNQFWVKTSEEDFPEGFVLPNTDEWVPKIPK